MAPPFRQLRPDATKRAQATGAGLAARTEVV
jgi:hypothetical protein